MPTIHIQPDPPSVVRKFKRNGDTYTAIYRPVETLYRLFNEATHEEVPATSQTFKRLADGNRGDRFKEIHVAPGYVVVLAYKRSPADRHADAYAGVRTWTPYPSKVEFERWYAKDGRKEYDIVAQNVSEAEAIRLCQQTPLRNMVRAAVADATDKDGFIHSGIARMKMMTVMLARGGNLIPIN